MNVLGVKLTASETEPQIIWRKIHASDWCITRNCLLTISLIQRLQSHVGKLVFRISHVLSDSTIRTIRDFLQLNQRFPPYAFINSYTKKNHVLLIQSIKHMNFQFQSIEYNFLKLRIYPNQLITLLESLLSTLPSSLLISSFTPSITLSSPFYQFRQIVLNWLK